MTLIMAFSIYYQNVRGLRTKTNILLRNVHLSSFDVIVLTETWLLDGIMNSELFPSNYTVWRRDRNLSRTNQTKGGGVLIAVRNNVCSNLRSEFYSSAEDIWVTLTIKKNKPRINYNLHICCVYLCAENGGYTFNEQLTNHLETVISIMNNNPLDKFIVVAGQR